MDTAVIYKSYLEYLLVYAEAQGLNSKEIIKKCSFGFNCAEQQKLPLTILDSDLQIVLQILHKHLGLEPFRVGLNLGFQLTSSDHGIVGLASLCSETVAESLQTYSDYFPIVSPVFKLFCYEDDQYFVCESICEYDISSASYDFLMALGVANGGLIGMNIVGYDTVKHKQKTVIEVAKYPDANKTLWEIFTPFAEISFNHDKTKLKIPLKISQQKLASANAQTRIAVLKLCDAELEKNKSDFMSRLKTIIKSELKHLLTAKEISELMAMSERSFHRKLNSLNTSYGKLCKEIKMQEAKKLLKQNDLSIKEIAFALSYSEVTNFSSAFKKAEGLSPKQYRSKSNIA